MNLKKNIAIGIPSARFVEFEFFNSFANSIARIMLGYNTLVIPVASPLIFENRNEILRRAFAAEVKTPGFVVDYFLWIDNQPIS